MMKARYLNKPVASAHDADAAAEWGTLWRWAPLKCRCFLGSSGKYPQTRKLAAMLRRLDGY